MNRRDFLEGTCAALALTPVAGVVIQHRSLNDLMLDAFRDLSSPDMIIAEQDAIEMMQEAGVGSIYTTTNPYW